MNGSTPIISLRLFLLPQLLGLRTTVYGLRTYNHRATIERRVRGGEGIHYGELLLYYYKRDLFILQLI
jgi:hypothetical protein